MYVRKVAEHPEDLKKPDDKDNNYHNIQYGLNFMVHRDVGVDKPEKNPGDNQYDNNR